MVEYVIIKPSKYFWLHSRWYSLSQVTGTMGGMQSGLNEHLSRLGEIFAARGDFVQTLQFMQQMSDNIIKQLLGLPDWEKAKVDLTAIADQTAYVEYYR